MRPPDAAPRRDAAEILDGIVALASDAVISLDDEQRITLFNRAAEEIFGYAAAEVLGQPLDLLIPQRFAERHRRVHLPAFAASPVSARRMGDRREVYGRRRNGDEFLAEVAISKTVVGGRHRYTALLRDVTEPRRTAALLRQSEATFRSAFEHSGIGMALLALDGRWLRVNGALCRFLGYDEAELLSLGFQDVTHPEDLAVELPLVRDLLDGTRTSYEIEKRHLRRDGSTVWGLVSRSVVRDDAGAPSFLIAQVQDVSARKAGEAALARHTEELKRSNAELEQFAYVASHDLQEPLRAVASYTALLAGEYGGRLDERADAWIRYAVGGAEQMQALISDLLELSRVGTSACPFAPTDLDTVLADALRMLQPAIAESGAAVVAEPLPTVLGDAIQLGQLMRNLIGNAVKFRRAGVPPRVRVSAAPGDGEWVVTVSDNGIGVDPRFAERIFVIFKRLHTREEYGGTGVGLAICRKIVERHGGRIWVEPADGGGAAFRFTLPEPSAPRAAPGEMDL